VITGSPLQNNLMEYHTMVEFARQGMLGTRREFANSFENPIRNGQHCDSTDADVRLMKAQSCVLHQMLKGMVHRRGFEGLQKDRPPKQESVPPARPTGSC